MRVYAVQLNCVWESPLENQINTRRLLQQVGVAPGSLIVLPEMFLTGFSLRSPAVPAEEGDAQERFLADLARAFDCAILGGLAARVAPFQRAHNQALAFAPDGTLLARYSKRRLFSLGGEHEAHQPGAQAVVFDFGGLRIAPMICYDLRFPELARETVALGAEMLIFIASWPAARIEHWLTLLRARAIENQAWVIGVNRCGRDPNFEYPGRSTVVDPHGVMVADAGGGERVLAANCDPEVVRNWRRDFPALRDAGLAPG